ncbi:MAG: D-alanine-D-alanine ligase-like ATP-grasp enzyme [Gammaproteobacteria bacterium]|jgi:D-alanine-D-alanine ligase-like ATP-grasp enzyme
MRKLKSLLYAWISKKFMHGCSNYNSVEVRRGCRSKAQGRAKFAENVVPHAQGLIYFWPWTAHAFARQHGFPLVIKPNVSGYSRGSYFPINDFKSLYKAIFLTKIWWPTSVIEQYLKGPNYRVLTTDHSFVSVIRRYSPFVTGNARDNIDQLIDAENIIRKQMNLYPTIYPIAKSDQVKAHLKKQKLTLQSIPDEGVQVELFYRVALAPGGVIEIIDQTSIPDINRDLFFNVVKMFDANVLGIDVIFEKGIDIPYTEQKCIFIEVNSRPYMKMHYFPRYGEVEDLDASLAALEHLEISDKDIY